MGNGAMNLPANAITVRGAPAPLAPINLPHVPGRPRSSPSMATLLITRAPALRDKVPDCVGEERRFGAGAKFRSVVFKGGVESIPEPVRMVVDAEMPRNPGRCAPHLTQGLFPDGAPTAKKPIVA